MIKLLIEAQCACGCGMYFYTTRIEEAYASHACEALHQHAQLIPACELAMRLDVSPSAVSLWHTRGWIQPAAHVDGQRMYDLDAVRHALAARNLPRKKVS